MSLPTTAPKYAQVLERRALAAEAELAAVLDGLNELRCYLDSPKFSAPEAGDRQWLVNVADVRLRLNETTYAGVLAGEAATR